MNDEYCEKITALDAFILSILYPIKNVGLSRNALLDALKSAAAIIGNVVRKEQLVYCTACGSDNIIVYITGSETREKMTGKTYITVDKLLYFLCLDCYNFIHQKFKEEPGGSKGISALGAIFEDKYQDAVNVEKNSPDLYYGLRGLRFSNTSKYYNDNGIRELTSCRVVVHRGQPPIEDPILRDAIQFTNGVFSNLLGGETP